MTLDQKRWVIGGLGLLFLLSLVSVQWLEVSRRSDNDEPLWRRVIAPPGAYTLVLRRAAPAGVAITGVLQAIASRIGRP